MKFGSLIALAAVVALGTFAQAQEASPKTDMTETKSMAAETKTAECDGTCPIAAAMGELPKMTYKVGEEATCCSKSAAALAEKNSLPIHFVVGENTFEKKEAAMTSLVETTETYVNAFITPCKCETSGTTKIAGKTCNCPVDAGKKAELVSTAASQVKMSYEVGEKSCNCPMKAASLAKTSGEDKLFVVGEEKTCCEMTARLNLARAKYKAAVKALATTTAAK